MKILICGGGGFIGQHLARYLLEQEFDIVILDRNKSKIESPRLKSFVTDLLRPDMFQEKWFSELEAVVNLSGKDIFTFWNKKNRKAIWESRITANRNLIDYLSKLPQKPRAFISASAVGFYGNRGAEELNESAPHGQGFLADVCVAWEREAQKAERLGMRSVQMRTAPVLQKNGGIIKQIIKSFRYGFAFQFGSGRNWFPWIHMQDLIRIYHEAIINTNIAGPVNACSPNPVQFKVFLEHLKQFKNALVVPFPALALKVLLQETADVVLFSQRMIPAKLLKIDFSFSFPELKDALREVFRDNA